jgi:ABC-type Fe3+ transport system substrate-binding protein
MQNLSNIPLAFLVLFIFNTPLIGAAALTRAEIATYNGADRQRLLEEGAKKEGTVTIYTSGIIQAGTGRWIDDFKKKYPFVTTQYWRAAGPAVSSRTVEEHRANRHVVDLFELDAGNLLTLMQVSTLQPYWSPELPAYPNDAKLEPRKDGVYGVVVRESYHGIGFNTEKINKSEAPKNFDDILNPKWKGKMAITSEGGAGVLFLGAVLSTGRGTDYLEKLARQNIRLHAMSARALADLVISGEVSVSPTISSAHVSDSKNKGAPIDWIPLNPSVTREGLISIAAKAPNPYTALLMIDFALTKAQQEMRTTFGYGVARSDVESPHSLPRSIKRFYPGFDPNYEDNFMKWRKLMNRYFANR